MGSAREWMAMGPLDPLDFMFVPSSMGQAAVARARPRARAAGAAASSRATATARLLMNLGALATISAAAPPNLVLVVFDNGVYEVTGAQPTPGSASGRARSPRRRLRGIARACGWPSVYRYSELDDWRDAAPTAINAPGPVFIALEVAPVPGAVGPKSPGPTITRAQKFRDALRIPKNYDPA